MQLGVNPVTSTSSPLPLTAGNVQQLACPSGGTSLSPTFSNFLPGMEMTFIFVQIPTGLSPCTVTFPLNMHGASTVSSSIGSVTTQKFIVSNNGTDLYAEGAEVCASSCGVP